MHSDKHQYFSATVTKVASDLTNTAATATRIQTGYQSSELKKTDKVHSQ